jgi:hypothetical protein
MLNQLKTCPNIIKAKIILKLAVSIDVVLFLLVTNNTIVARVNNKILGTIRAQIPTQ